MQEQKIQALDKNRIPVVSCYRKDVICTVKLFLPLLLAATLLLASCTEEMSPSAASSSPTSSEQTSIESTLDTEDSSLSEQVSAEIILTPDPLLLQGGITFTFPQGWESLGEGSALDTASPDGNLAVTAFFTPDDGQITLTEELLESEIFPSLVSAWETYGMTEVEGTMQSCTLAEKECPTVFLSGSYEGIPVFQKQVYLFTEGGYLTVTVTSYGTDQTDYLLTLFA